MTISESQKRATNKYLKKAYDQVNIRVKAGKRVLYQEYFKMHPEKQMNKTIESYLDSLIADDPILSNRLSEFNKE